jgi:bacterioferritin-associated ferredoxin
MIVCSCNVLSDGDIRGCAMPGPGCPRTAAEVYRCLGCSPQCGRCATTIRSILSRCPTGEPGCPGDAETCTGACGERPAWQMEGSLAALSRDDGRGAPAARISA